MLSLVALVDQWKVIESNLPEGWTGAQLRLTVDDEPERARRDARARGRRPARERRHVQRRRGGRRVRRRISSRGCSRGWTPSGIRRRRSSWPVRSRASAPAGGALARRSARRAVGAGTGDSAGGLERPLRRGRARLERLPRARRAAARAGQPGALQGGGSRFRFRVARRFGYGASAEMTRALPRAPRRRGDQRQLPRPARALRHEAGLHAGPGLVRRRPGRLSGRPRLLVPDRAGLGGRRQRRRGDRQGRGDRRRLDARHLRRAHRRHRPAEQAALRAGRARRRDRRGPGRADDRQGRFERLDEYQEPPTTEEIEAP